MEQTAKYEGSIPTLARRAGALGQLGHLSVLSLFVEQGSDDHLQWGGGWRGVTCCILWVLSEGQLSLLSPCLCLQSLCAPVGSGNWLLRPKGW